VTGEKWDHLSEHFQSIALRTISRTLTEIVRTIEGFEMRANFVPGRRWLFVYMCMEQCLASLKLRELWDCIRHISPKSTTLRQGSGSWHRLTSS
jgi:hypothetical protein